MSVCHDKISCETQLPIPHSTVLTCGQGFVFLRCPYFAQSPFQAYSGRGSGYGRWQWRERRGGSGSHGESGGGPYYSPSWFVLEAHTVSQPLTWLRRAGVC